MNNTTKRKRSTGAGCQPHPLKGTAATISLRLYPIDRAYLEFKHGSVTNAISTLCTGNEYQTYLMQQVAALTSKNK